MGSDGGCGKGVLAIQNPQSKIKNRFSAAHRLHGRRAFAAVYDAKMRKAAGPLLVFTRPNGLPHFRLGLSVSRRVGKAVVRSRVKRMLREAFRLTQQGWPMLPPPEPREAADDAVTSEGASAGGSASGGGMDLVVVVRPHAGLTLTQYQALLGDAVEAAHRGWVKRQRP